MGQLSARWTGPEPLMRSTFMDWPPDGPYHRWIGPPIPTQSLMITQVYKLVVDVSLYTPGPHVRDSRNAIVFRVACDDNCTVRWNGAHIRWRL